MENQDDLDTLADSISDVVLPAPEIQQENPVSYPDDVGFKEQIELLREFQKMLMKIDRMLISSGARLVLFLPLAVIVLYGLSLIHI